MSEAAQKKLEQLEEQIRQRKERQKRQNDREDKQDEIKWKRICFQEVEDRERQAAEEAKEEAAQMKTTSNNIKKLMALLEAEERKKERLSNQQRTRESSSGGNREKEDLQAELRVLESELAQMRNADSADNNWWGELGGRMAKTYCWKSKLNRQASVLLIAIFCNYFTSFNTLFCAFAPLNQRYAHVKY